MARSRTYGVYIRHARRIDCDKSFRILGTRVKAVFDRRFAGEIGRVTLATLRGKIRRRKRASREKIRLSTSNAHKILSKVRTLATSSKRVGLSTLYRLFVKIDERYFGRVSVEIDVNECLHAVHLGRLECFRDQFDRENPIPLPSTTSREILTGARVNDVLNEERV